MYLAADAYILVAGSQGRVMLRRRSVTALLVLVALIGLRAALRRDHAPSATGPGSPAGLTFHVVAPAASDPGLTGPDAPSLAIVPRAARFNGLLLVFLPGTRGTPGCCTRFLERAAELGYHAVGLTYDNQTAVGVRCLNDLGCFARIRANVFDGSDPSRYSALPTRDGIAHRLGALLAHLAARYPSEGWSRFLRRGQPQWSSTVLSGHSQGGGEAAFIGTLRPLRGVIALSSPPDSSISLQPASWLESVPRGRTPIGRIVAFVHSGDPFYGRILADWEAMTLRSLGAPASVDGVGPPYGNSHELVSSAALPAVALAAHDSTAVDSATPTCADGSPRYATVWAYMLQVAGGLKVSVGIGACPG